MEKMSVSGEKKALSLLHRQNRQRIIVGLLAMVIFLCAGCTSGFVAVAPRVPEKFEKRGPAQGSACGFMLFDFGGGAWFSVFPVTLNDRVERAYQRALESVPGSTALINVTMKEDWFWWGIGNSRCVTISGEAIK